MIEIVSNDAEYFEFIRQLRNDSRVKHGFVEQSHITRDEQAVYMAQHASEYVVALCDGVPAGYAGSVEGDIRVCTHPDFAGRGIGRALIRELMKRFPGSVARVKTDNLPSRRLFESCGFEVTFVVMEQVGGDAEEGGER